MVRGSWLTVAQLSWSKISFRRVAQLSWSKISFCQVLGSWIAVAQLSWSKISFRQVRGSWFVVRGSWLAVAQQVSFLSSLSSGSCGCGVDSTLGSVPSMFCWFSMTFVDGCRFSAGHVAPCITSRRLESFVQALFLDPSRLLSRVGPCFLVSHADVLARIIVLRYFFCSVEVALLSCGATVINF